LQQETSVAFDALSYVWGSPNDPHTVDVNIALNDGTTKAFKVSVIRNLATTLQHLRRTDVARTVWADAICINQHDYDERAQQVLMMGDIYRCAQNVVAFLGPTMSDSTIAMGLISKISRVVKVDFGSGLVEPSTEGEAEPGWVDMHTLLDIEHEHLLALFHLLNREWFERLWIRQEIGLGGDWVSLLCGHDSIEWSSFCRAIFVLHRRTIESLGILDGIEQDSLRDRLGMADTVALFSKRAFRFTNLRRQIGRSKYTDQRDRIYGVLGQLRDAAQIGIIPDYNETVAEVYIDATQKNIRPSQGLSVLCQCTEDCSLHLPSWVPDWSTPLFSASVHEARPPFFDPLPAWESIEDKVLRAYGLRCGSISQVARPFGDSLEGVDDFTTAQAVQDVLVSVKRHVAHTGDELVTEARYRCLLLNNFATRWMPTVPYEAPFEECMALVRALLSPSKTMTETIAIPEASHCLNKLRGACRDRALIVTDTGHLGMGPDSASSGDEFYLLFGTWKPAILRPAVQEQHCVVGGECYVHGMMSAEPILGPIPQSLRGLLDPMPSAG
ncbi:uncharacterized protein M421DRAFT_59119, partial [Didymella exigua CBS 183.55]